VEAPSPEQRERFERDGYLIFDSGIAPKTIDRVVADLEPEFIPESERPPPEPTLVDRILRRPPRPRFAYTDHIRVQDAWRSSRDVKAIARAPSIMGLLRGLYGREPLPFQTLNFRLGTEQSPHADAFHFNSQPPGFMCGVWVALEDIDESSGPLVYFPGSQKLPETNPSALGMRPTEEDYPIYEAHVQAEIARHGFEPRLALLRKGEAVLWAANLLHGGSPTEPGEQTRRSQVTHYYFEGCRYWTPMLSYHGHTTWRDPAWIE
jgi:hypothetical protein